MLIKNKQGSVVYTYTDTRNGSISAGAKVKVVIFQPWDQKWIVPQCAFSTSARENSPG